MGCWIQNQTENSLLIASTANAKEDTACEMRHKRAEKGGKHHKRKNIAVSLFSWLSPWISHAQDAFPWL